MLYKIHDYFQSDTVSYSQAQSGPVRPSQAKSKKLEVAIHTHSIQVKPSQTHSKGVKSL